MEISNRDLFCPDLPTQPIPEIGKILVTGGSGYIGGRLVPELKARGYQVRVMVRNSSIEYEDRWPETEIQVADAVEGTGLDRALEGIHTAYYLMHSLLVGKSDFEAHELQAASNFQQAAARQKVKRIIYLGGLGDVRTKLSAHLRSRAMVAEELARGPVPLTILRAAIIIGSGSASYEIIKNLVKAAPVLLIPRWATTRCQPISVRDVTKYLVGVLEIPQTAGKIFDIGGEEILTYEEMLRILADLLALHRRFIHWPVSSVGFYAYLTSLLTPVPAPITRSLIEGIKNNVVCQDASIKEYLGFKTLSYKEALLRAMSREEQDNIYTRWSDAYPPAHELALKLFELREKPHYTSVYSVLSAKKPSSLFNSICRIGGKEGWFNTNWMWWLRGMLDRILSGVGTARGRRSTSTLRINDVLDFWRVEDLVRDRLLLLRAEMKLPGLAWLEFSITPEGDKHRLQVTAYFHTAGLAGKLYWYAFLPFHYFIFHDLILEIEKRS
jgi:uncharacterized protein YbjT (DUF2867 family)